MSLRKLYKGYEIKNFLLYSLHHEQKSSSDKRRKRTNCGLQQGKLFNKKIAKELNRSRCVIKCFLDDPGSYGKKYVGERPKKLSKRNQRCLIREASRGEYSCKQLKDKLDLDVHVLKDHLLPFVETKEHEFQKDKAPIHVSKATRAFFQESNMQVMDWPACSPDLNLIENVWGLLSRSIYGSGRQYDSEKDLKEAIWSAWRNLDENVIKTLIFSMKNRCIDVISKKGGITSY